MYTKTAVLQLIFYR